MTKETIQAQESAVLQECAAENCIIKLGAAIGADYIVKSGIRKFGPKFTLTVEMYETKNGTLAAVLPEPVRSEKLYDILEKTTAVCVEMYKKFVNTQSGTLPQPQPPAPPPQPPAPPPPPPPPPPVATAYTLKLYISSPSAGTITLNPNQTSYAQGTRVTVTANTASGYEFKNWTGASTASTNPVIITMDGNKTLTAMFQQKPQPQPQPPSVDGSGTFTDNRDKKTYRTVVIVGKRWMAENLNYYTGNSWCYNNDNSYCNKYGRLYDWNTAMSACPTGWHLPSRLEWADLAKAAGGTGTYGDSGTASKKLKARSGWNDFKGKDGNGTDDYGFSALPGGSRSNLDGIFYYGANYGGYWWTSTEDMNNLAYHKYIYHGRDNMDDIYYDKSNGYSVRCVADFQQRSQPQPQPPYQPPAPRPATQVNPSGNSIPHWYLNAVRSKIESNWRPGMENSNISVVISFEIHRDGSAHNIKITSSSGDVRIDKSGIDAVARSSPFGKLPPDFKEDKLEINITLRPTRKY
jgi:TonB family protein